MTRSTVTLSLSSDREPDGSYPWLRRGGLCVKGYLYGGTGLVEGAALLNHFQQAENVEAFERLVREANGYFAVVFDGGDELWAAVDRVSSTPIMYTDSGSIVVGDDFQGFLSSGSAMSRAGMDQFLAERHMDSSLARANPAVDCAAILERAGRLLSQLFHRGNLFAAQMVIRVGPLHAGSG